MSPTRSDAAWAAGFFDGEGHISMRDRTGRGHLEKYKSPRSIILAITQLDDEVLLKFQAVMAGRGKIYAEPRTAYRERKQAMVSYTRYQWRTGKRGDILFVVERMWPGLGSIKRLQAATAIVKHTELDPHQLQVVPDYLRQYYNDRAGDVPEKE